MPSLGLDERRQYGDPPADEGLPAEFVAELHARIVVVSAATGRVVRRLTADQAGGGASDPAVSPDGRTVWFSRGDGSCAAHLASVPAAGGPERSLPGSGGRSAAFGTTVTGRRVSRWVAMSAAEVSDTVTTASARFSSSRCGHQARW